MVYESTVYPGVTEEICVPIIERYSGLRCGIEFKVGYSPERVNPGDKEHSLDKIVKIVAGKDKETTELLEKVYGSIINAGIYKVSSIKVAEAAKVIENIQRDLNIALMNELSIIFNKMGLDTLEILDAAATKWNFVRFEPGLVGGHCIPVDPYYLTFKAEEIGYHPEVILAGRRINDYMGKYIANETIKCLIKASKNVRAAKVLILGITFKENTRDIRNTKVIDIVKELEDYNIKTFVYDPIADKETVENVYEIKLLDNLEERTPYDAIIIAVKHKFFLESFNLEKLKQLQNTNPVLIDVKGIYDKNEAVSSGFIYFRL